MRKRLIPLALALLLVVLLLSGCGEKPLEEARELQINGFKTSYHQYMWTPLGTNEAEGISEVTYNHTESDAYFAAVRINAETAKAQSLTDPEGMETLLNTYVANYAGTKEKITANDNETEYVRELSFEYQDTEAGADFTYLAKLVLNKDNGEMMVLLAAHPKNSGSLLKEELALIMGSAEMQEMTTV